MNTRQLQCFVEVGKTLSFSKAAQNLFLTQSSVTYQVTQLEQELGVTLLIRNTRSIRLSAQGEVFLKDAQRLLELMTESIERLHGKQDSARKKLVLLNHHTEEDGIYKPSLIAYSQNHPEVELRLKNAEYEFSQVNPDILVTARSRESMEKHCDPECIFPLRKLRAYAVVLNTHPLAGKAELSADDVAGYPLLATHPSIMPSHDWDLWYYLSFHKDRFHILPVDRVSIMETNSRLYSVPGAVKITVGRRVNFEPSLVQIPFSTEMTNLTLKVGITRGNESQEAQALVDYLIGEYCGKDDLA